MGGFLLQVLDDYPLGTANGACYLCRASKRPGEVVVDTEITVEYEGFLMVCETCVTDLGHRVGMLSEGEFKDLNVQLAEAYRYGEELRSKLAVTTAALAALRDVDALLPAPEVAVAPAVKGSGGSTRSCPHCGLSGFVSAATFDFHVGGCGG